MHIFAAAVPASSAIWKPSFFLYWILEKQAKNRAGRLGLNLLDILILHLTRVSYLLSPVAVFTVMRMGFPNSATQGSLIVLFTMFGNLHQCSLGWGESFDAGNTGDESRLLG